MQSSSREAKKQESKVGPMKSPALWIPSAELERAGSSVPFGGGKSAGLSENELKVVFLLPPEKKPKPAQFNRVKSLIMVLLLSVTLLQKMKAPRARSLWPTSGTKLESEAGNV